MRSEIEGTTSQHEVEMEKTLQLGDSSSTDLENLINGILGPLADDYSIRILSATREKGKTVRELSRDLDVPIATCYRRVKELLDASLLKNEEKRLTAEGKRANVLRSNVSSVEVSFKFEDQKLKVAIETFGA